VGLGEVEVTADFTEASGDTSAKFKVDIRSRPELTDEHASVILVIAHKCPVHKALMGPTSRSTTRSS